MQEETEGRNEEDGWRTFQTQMVTTRRHVNKRTLHKGLHNAKRRGCGCGILAQQPSSDHL